MFFHDLETERLWLRGVNAGDRQFLFEQFTDPAVCEFLFDAEPFQDVAEADELIGFYTQLEPRGQHRWVLVRKADGAPLGTCGFHCWNPEEGTVQTGYDLRAEHRGHGYMAEAMTEALRFARREMKVRRVDAVIYRGNRPSIALAERMGFRPSGETSETFRGEQIPHFIYSLDCVSNGPEESK